MAALATVQSSKTAPATDGCQGLLPDLYPAGGVVVHQEMEVLHLIRADTASGQPDVACDPCTVISEWCGP